MDKKSFTNYHLLTTLLTGIILIGMNYKIHAQDSYKISGPVSELKISANGNLGCQLHFGDDIAENHQELVHQLGSPQQTSNGKKGMNDQGATIFVDYFNFDAGFNDKFIEAVTAFQSAIDAWASSIDSEVPIYVAAVFQPLGDGVLGSAGSTGIFANYEGLERNTWYGSALADKLTGQDIDPSSYDIIARFSTVFPNWYFGTDGNTPANDYDFKTVVMHELGHGLGFFGSMFVDNNTGTGSYGFGIPNPVYPAIYDRLHSSSDGKSILKDNKYPNFSMELGDALLSGTLNAKGPRIKKATNGKGAEMFTVLDSDIFGNIPGLTDVWLPGSSYSHVDFLTYFGGPDGLMVPFLSTGLAYSEPGDLTLAIFDDMGWNGKVNREVQNGRIAQNEFDEIIHQGLLKVYPNPISDNLSISMENIKNSLTDAELIDTMGRNIKLDIRNFTDSYIDFDLTKASLKPGAYILRLQFENQEFTNIKLVKN